MTITKGDKEMKEHVRTQAALVLAKTGRDGKETRSTKTLSRVSNAVENTTLYDTMKKFGALQKNPVKAIRRVTTTEMTEEA